LSNPAHNTYWRTFTDVNIGTRAGPVAPADPGVSGGSKTWTSTSRTITASNATAGTYAIDHYDHRTYSDSSVSAVATGQSVTISASGATWAQFRAVDTHGNFSAWYPSHVDPAAEARIDTTGPTVPQVVGGFPNAVDGPVAVHVCCSKDADSGIAGYDSRTSTNNGSTWSSPASVTDNQVIISATGTTLVQFRAVDNVGNTSAWGGPSSYTSGGDSSNQVVISSGAGTGTNACTTFTDPFHGDGWIDAGDEGGDGKVHLTVAGSPWIVDCQLTDTGGVPLVVDPGAVIELTRGVIVGGVRVASGITVSGSITVGSNSGPQVIIESTDGAAGVGTPGDWGGIAVNDTGNGTSSFTNVAMMYGGGSTGTTPVIATGSGNVTVDHGTFSVNYTDTASSTKPGVLTNSNGAGSGGVHTLTISHSYIEHNTGNGVKSVDATLVLDHNNFIDDNTGFGVWFSADAGASSYSMGSVNHSSISENGMNGIHITINNSPTGLTYPTGANNNMASNGGGGHILVDGFPVLSLLQYSTFDWRNNYLGPVPVEYTCPVDAAPGSDPVDPLFDLPYQMRGGVNLLLDTIVQIANRRQSGLPDDPETEWVAREMEANTLAAINDIGYPDWFAIPQGSNPQASATIGSITCYYDLLPTAPAKLAPVDNSSS
jgi:hypothetical protein